MRTHTRGEAVHRPVFGPLLPHPHHHIFPAKQTPLFRSQFFPTSDMSDQPGLSNLQVLFEAALQDYETQMGITLAKHPLAEQLQNCHSVESVTAVLRDQTQAFSKFLGNDKVLKLLEKVVSVLCKLSAHANFGPNIGLVRP